MEAETGTGARLVAGRYRLAAELGRGGMGVVWLADDQLAGRRVAVKELRPPPGLTPADRETSAQRALQEARSAARIHHPGAVTLYDVLPASDGDDAVYLIMELVEGPTLAQAIAHQGPLAEATVAGFGLQLLEVLAAAHALGIVHRDIKPANILITPAGQAKLTDFGIAHTIGDLRLTRSGILGTQAYLAPELFESAPITPAADLWSLGATLYAAAQGRSPFERDTTSATLRAILIDDPPAPRCSPALAAALAGMLQRDPARRATTSQARAALQAAARTTHVPPAGQPVGPPQPPWAQRPTTRSPAPPPPRAGHRSAPPPPQPRRRPRTAVMASATAVTVVLIAAAITGGILATGHHHNPSHPTAVRAVHRARPLSAPALHRLIATLNEPQSIMLNSVAFSPDGRTLATGDSNFNAYVWSTATHRMTATLADPSSTQVDVVAFSPDGQTLATGDDQGTIYLWSTSTHKVTAALSDPYNSEVTWLAFSPDGQTLASAQNLSNNNHIYISSIATKKITARLIDPNSLGPLYGVFSPNGQTLAVGDNNGGIYLWDVATRSITATLADPNSQGVNWAEFSADGQMLAAGDITGRTYLWNMTTHGLAATLPGPGSTDGVGWLALSPDGQTLATAYLPASSSGNPFENTVYLWNTATRKLTATLTDPGSHGAQAGAFSPDGRTLAIADGNGRTYLWHVPAGG